MNIEKNEQEVIVSVIDVESNNNINKKEINEMNDNAKTESNKNENFSIVSSKPKKSMLCGGNKSKEYSFKPLINDDALKKIREGWNFKNVGDLTVGDLYLMFGSDSKLTIEYKWNDVNENISNNSMEQENKVEMNPLGNKLKNLLSIANLIENPIACSHNSEKNHLGDMKDVVINESSTFKQPSISKPYFDPYVRPLLNMNPRLKPHQSKWWRNQQLYRYRMPTDGLIPNNFKNNAGNHVIRNLYETPPSTSHSSSGNGENSDDLTRTLEDKIQNLTSKNSNWDADSPYIQNFSESSRSSIRSLLETLSSSKSSYDYGENLIIFLMQIFFILLINFINSQIIWQH